MKARTFWCSGVIDVGVQIIQGIETESMQT